MCLKNVKMLFVFSSFFLSFFFLSFPLTISRYAIIRVPRAVLLQITIDVTLCANPRGLACAYGKANDIGIVSACASIVAELWCAIPKWKKKLDIVRESSLNHNEKHIFTRAYEYAPTPTPAPTLTPPTPYQEQSE